MRLIVSTRPSASPFSSHFGPGRSRGARCNTTPRHDTDPRRDQKGSSGSRGGQQEGSRVQACTLHCTLRPVPLFSGSMLGAPPKGGRRYRAANEAGSRCEASVLTSSHRRFACRCELLGFGAVGVKLTSSHRRCACSPIGALLAASRRTRREDALARGARRA